MNLKMEMPRRWTVAPYAEGGYRRYQIIEAGEVVAHIPLSRKKPSGTAYFIAAAPDVAACLQEMLDAFVPTVRAGYRLTQAQGGAVANAKRALEKALKQ